MLSLWSKLGNEQLAFLGLLDRGGVSVGLCLDAGRKRGAAGRHNFGTGLPRHFSLLQTRNAGLAEAPAGHHGVGFAGGSSAPHHCIAE